MSRCEINDKCGWAGDVDTLRWHKSKAGLVLPIPRRRFGKIMLLQLLSPFEMFLLCHKNQTVVALQNQISRRNAGQVSNGDREGRWKHNLLALCLKMK